MQANTSSPLISIGMPIYNEGPFLEAALSALVSQADVRTEIIISDNASTDNSADICKSFCVKHPNIRYHRFEKNQGVRANFDYVLKEALGDYFIWASGHDRWDENFLFECSNALINNEKSVLAFGNTQWIDSDGAPFPRSSGWSDTRGLHVIARFCTVFWGNMNPILGLIRTETLKNIEVMDIVGSDLVMLLCLSLKGDFVHAPQTTWYRREFRKEANYQKKLERYRSKNYALGSSFLSRIFPLAALPFAILKNILTSKLHWLNKLGLCILMMASFPIKYFSDRSKAN